MDIQQLSKYLRGLILPSLDEDSQDFIDTNYNAREWEIVSGVIIADFIKHGVRVPREVLPHLEVIDDIFGSSFRTDLTEDLLVPDTELTPV